MSLLKRLNEDMKQAMKNKDKENLSFIRMLVVALQNEAIKLGKEQLSEEEELEVLSREIKQRQDSLHEFENEVQQDLLKKIRYELSILNSYIPARHT